MSAARPAIPTPSWLTTAGELTGLLELPRLGWELRSLLREPAGDGSTVFVLPGFGADDRSTWPLRQFLTALGYEARGWGRGANRAAVPDTVADVGEQVAQATQERGWALRELRRDDRTLEQVFRELTETGAEVTA